MKYFDIRELVDKEVYDIQELYKSIDAKIDVMGSTLQDIKIELQHKKDRE